MKLPFETIQIKVDYFLVDVGRGAKKCSSGDFPLNINKQTVKWFSTTMIWRHHLVGVNLTSGPFGATHLLPRPGPPPPRRCARSAGRASPPALWHRPPSGSQRCLSSVRRIPMGKRYLSIYKQSNKKKTNQTKPNKETRKPKKQTNKQASKQTGHNKGISGRSLRLKPKKQREVFRKGQFVLRRT